MSCCGGTHKKEKGIATSFLLCCATAVLVGWLVGMAWTPILTFLGL